MSRLSRPAALARLAAVPPSKTLLVTDFDGTIAPIVADPPAAVALPEALHALERLDALGVRAVVLSGRPTSFLEQHVPLPGVRLLGDNGLGRPTAADSAALAQYCERAREAIGRRPGLTLVRTPGSAVVHFRAAPHNAGGLLGELSGLAAPLGLVAGPGRMVVEARPRRATKARAIRRLIGELGPDCLAFAGDDEGDRDAFDLVAAFDGVHLAVGVSSEETGPDLFARCDLVLDDPAALAAFLSGWVRRLAAD